MTKLRVSNVHWSIQMSVLAGPDAQCAPTQRQRIRSFLVRQKCSFSTQSNTKPRITPGWEKPAHRQAAVYWYYEIRIMLILDVRWQNTVNVSQFVNMRSIIYSKTGRMQILPCFLERIMLASCNTARYIQYVRWGLSTSYMKNLCLIKLIKNLWLKPAAIFACFCFVCFYFDDLWII